MSRRQKGVTPTQPISGQGYRGPTNPLPTRDRYLWARRRAEGKAEAFSLTEEQYAALVARPCAYCEDPLSLNGVGLDQRRAYEGYTLENAVPACRACLDLRNKNYTPAETSAKRLAIKRVMQRI